MRKNSPVICRNLPCSFLDWVGADIIGDAGGGGDTDAAMAAAEGVSSTRGSRSKAAIGSCTSAGAAVTPWHICDSDRPAANSIALAAMVCIN